MKDKVDLRKFLSGEVGEVFYSPLCGECILRSVSECDELCIEIEPMSTTGAFLLNKYGQLNEYGETMIFPSETDRDWNLYFFPNKGDAVIVSDDGVWWAIGKYCYGNVAQIHPGGDFNWKYIVPASDFDFSNMESNVEKSIV